VSEGDPTAEPSGDGGSGAPRLLVPGVLDVHVLDDGSGLIELGPLADVPPSLPQQEDLERSALVPVQALPSGLRSDLDLAIHPLVAARLQRARWALLPREQALELHQAGHPILEVEGGIAGARWMPAQGPARRCIAPDHALWTLLLGPDGQDDPRAARWAETGALLDRIIHAMTDGAVDLRDLELARWADGLRVSSLDREEALLAEIDERAQEHAPVAAEIAAALGGAPGHGSAVEVPVYGSATRVVDPGFTLSTGGGVTVDGPDIHVPEAIIWQVDEVEPWEPSRALEHRAATFEAWHARIQDTRKRGRRRELVVWGLIGVLLILGLAVGLLGQLALSRGQPDRAGSAADTDAPMDTDRAAPAR